MMAPAAIAMVLKTIPVRPISRVSLRCRVLFRCLTATAHETLPRPSDCPWLRGLFRTVCLTLVCDERDSTWRLAGNHLEGVAAQVSKTPRGRGISTLSPGIHPPHPSLSKDRGRGVHPPSCFQEDRPGDRRDAQTVHRGRRVWGSSGHHSPERRRCP